MPDSLQTKLKVNFDTVTERTSLESGENISLSLAKTKKYLDDLGNAAFKDIDSTPTASSTNPVSSGGVYTDQVRQDTLEAQDRAALIEVENKGAKNIAEVTAVSSTAGGVEYTVNPDGTVIANRVSSSSSSTWFRLNNNLSLKAGTYVLSGGKNADERVLLSPTASLADAIADSQGSGAEFTLTEDTDNLIYAIRVAYTDSPSNVKFYPMICSKAEWDISSQFEPYALANPVLTSALIEQVDSGAKNILQFDGLTKTLHNGVAFTLNQDGTIKMERVEANSSASTSILTVSGSTLEIDSLCNGHFYLSGCPSGGSETTFEISATTASGSANPYIKRDYGSGVLLVDKGSSSNIRVQLIARSAFTGSVIFKPMLCSKADWDISHQYEPYALPNPPITAKMIEEVDGGCKNLSQFNSGTAAADNVTLATGVPLVGHAGEALVFSYETTLSSGIVTIGFKDANGTATGSVEIGNVTKQKIVTIPENTAKFNVFVSKAGTYTNFMICTLTDWNISHKYVPYKQDITWGLGDKIPQNSDFNSYTIPGVYRVENSTDAATMLHCPTTTDGGRLEVSIGDTSTEILHTYFSGNAEYRRSYNGTTWSDWVQILSTATLDEIPTANSTNAVMSGGVWTDQQRQETEIGVVANAGAKNLFAITAQSDIKQGVRFTVNDDGTVTVNRESAGTAGAFFTVGEFTGDSVQMYTLNGCPATGSDSTYYMYIGSSYRDYGSGVTREGGTLRNVVIYVDKNYSPDNLTFKPMIRPAAITDPTFQPYAKTNRAITVAEDEDRAALIELVDGGAKNKLPVDELGLNADHGANYTNQGVMFSLASDGTITATRTEAGTADALCNLRFSGSSFYVNALCNGRHILSGCPSGGGSGTYRLEAHGVTADSYDVYDTGQSAILSQYTGSVNVVIRIRVAQNYAADNVVFRPMICSEAAWDISHAYQPYRPSYQELYEMVLALQNGTRSLSMRSEPEVTEQPEESEER